VTFSRAHWVFQERDWDGAVFGRDRGERMKQRITLAAWVAFTKPIMQNP